MLKPLLVLGLLHAVLSPLVVEAQTPEKAEAIAIITDLKPVIFGGHQSSVSASFLMQRDYVVLDLVAGPAEAGQRRRYDPCNGLFVLDRHVKALDEDTIVATRTGSLRLMVVDVSSVVANYTITDVIHRDSPPGGWKIAHEQVTIWPRDKTDDVCNVVRMQ